MNFDDEHLDQICNHHDDLAARLRYADYLEESGRCERAEFIRNQIELAALPEPDQITIGYLMPTGTAFSDIRRRVKGACRNCRALVDGEVVYCRYHTISFRQHDLLQHYLEDLSIGIPGTCINLLGGWPFQADSSSEFKGVLNRTYLEESFFGFEFKKGFAEIICCSWDKWRDTHLELTSRTPLREVILLTVPSFREMRPCGVCQSCSSRSPTICRRFIDSLAECWPKIKFFCAPEGVLILPISGVAPRAVNVREGLLDEGARRQLSWARRMPVPEGA